MGLLGSARGCAAICCGVWGGCQLVGRLGVARLRFKRGNGRCAMYGKFGGLTQDVVFVAVRRRRDRPG